MKKMIVLVMLIGLVIPWGVRAEERVGGRAEKRVEVNEIRVNLQEVRSKVAENHANRLERRFKFYYERLSKIMVKFQARIDYLKDQGKDTAAVQTKLDAAKAKLESAKVKGEAAVAAFRAIEPGKWEEQKPALLAAKDLAEEARGLFKDAFKLLKDALKELKNISKPALPAASPAVEED